MSVFYQNLLIQAYANLKTGTGSVLKIVYTKICIYCRFYTDLVIQVERITHLRTKLHLVHVSSGMLKLQTTAQVQSHRLE